MVVSKRWVLQRKTENREQRAVSGGGSKIRSQVKKLKHVGARRGILHGIAKKYLKGEKRERWVLLKIPRGDIDGVGEVK